MAFGLRSVKNAYAGYTSGGFLQFQAADSYATAIFNGDPVTINTTTGYAEVDAGVPTDTSGDVVGFMCGCRYVNTSGTPTWSQYYPASGGTEVYIFVAPCDKGALFEVAGANSWNINQTGVQNAVAAGSGGSTFTGNSSYVVTNATASASTGAVIIRGVKKDGSNENSSTPILYVQIADGVSLYELGA